ncbi:unnamed protein product [Rotaria magnacalcarata]
MTDIYSIKPGTVFAWFMLVLVIRRIVLVVMLIASGIVKSSGAASQPVEVARNGNSGKGSKELASSDKADLPTLINNAITNDSENDTYFLILYLGTENVLIQSTRSSLDQSKVFVNLVTK